MDVYAKMSKFKFWYTKNLFTNFPKAHFVIVAREKHPLRIFQPSPDCWSPEFVSVFLNTLCETVLFHVSICTETNFTVFGFSSGKSFCDIKSNGFFYLFFCGSIKKKWINKKETRLSDDVSVPFGVINFLIIFHLSLEKKILIN